MHPYFSIIIPIYNIEAHLEHCVCSVVTQSFTDYEVILVDDGSKDNSGQLCDQLAARYPAVQVIHQPNQGLSGARNAGLAAAKGEYVWFVDGDDWILPDTLDTLYALATAHHPDVLKCNYLRVTKTQTPFFSVATVGSYTGDAQRETLLRQMLCRTGQYGMSAWSHLYKRAFLQQHHLTFVHEREIGSEDYLFNIQSLLRAQSVYVTDALVYGYRLRVGSLSQTYKTDLYERFTRLYHLLSEDCEKQQTPAYIPLISSFYVWHLIHSTYMSAEYTASETHTIETGRQNVRRCLRDKNFQQAVRRCDTTCFSAKQRLQLTAMRWGFEKLFYWLYVVKQPTGEDRK